MAKPMSIANYHTPTPGSRKALGKASPLFNSFSLIEYTKDVRFLIMDCPTDSTIPLYLKEFARLNVTDVVRVCEPTYNKQRLNDHGIRVLDLPFKDGDVPPPSVIKRWLELVNERVAASMDTSLTEQQPVPTTIAVHCVAGLGRAPVLVAVALIERNMDPVDVIELVRKKRRGAFNNPQINYLVVTYKRTSASKASIKLASNLKQQASHTPTDSLPASPVNGQNDQPGGSKSPNTHSKSLFRKIFGILL
ncbi:hypothetical protein GGI07_005231 [Coemansia sp. Benny D115]|nr:hypothetical protein GGI07_005231 [Coemansia sp. Benny D115]